MRWPWKRTRVVTVEPISANLLRLSCDAGETLKLAVSSDGTVTVGPSALPLDDEEPTS